MRVTLIEHQPEIIILIIEGRIDSFTAETLKGHIEPLLADDISRFVIDLGLTSFIDSAGMATLVSLMKKSRYKGGDLKLIWPHSEAARHILNLMRFDMVFDIRETLNEALARFETET